MAINGNQRPHAHRQTFNMTALRRALEDIPSEESKENETEPKRKRKRLH